MRQQIQQRGRLLRGGLEHRQPRATHTTRAGVLLYLQPLRRRQLAIEQRA
jgi:hypothetical protein